MPKASIEERLAALEKQVADLKTAFENCVRPRDWRSTMGMFTGNEGMKEIFEEALKYREKDQEKARRKFAKEDERKRARQRLAKARRKATTRPRAT